MSKLLDVQGLSVGRHDKGTFSPILKDVSFSINEGEFTAIVGESGCGKSMTSLAIMGLTPKTLNINSGSIYYKGKDLTKMSDKEMNRVRGKDITMIFQEPMTSLNPSFTIGNQIAEVYKYHTDLSNSEIMAKSIDVLEQVKIPNAKEKLKLYPHELSGGMRQRVMIAMALACNPKVLIADEPTTALDVTIQAQILSLLSDLQRDLNMSIIMITHDLGVVAETCQKVIVMYAGQVIEEASVEDIFDKPVHPYTRDLIQSVPKIGQRSQEFYTIKGSVPNIDNMPKGCRFHPRCNEVMKICSEKEPVLEGVGEGRSVRCWNKM
ncbi:ABC transporter ATP-binding protein [Neobacillus sp. SAB-20_R2A]|uniref:ABC transporter ATP-binding protein n=1 Tax=Neobacillus sp. SAB-20_R2A TaxID=3120519 RepID=UPI003C6E5674